MTTFVLKCLNPLKQVQTSNLRTLSIWARSNKAKKEEFLRTRELCDPSLSVHTLFFSNGHPVGFLRARRRQLVSDLCTLHNHVREKRLEAALALLKDGADVNARHPGTGDTPLHVAVENADPAMVEMLFGFDIDPRVENDKGLTAFRLAEAKQAEQERNGIDDRETDVYRVFWILFSSNKINF